jgi:hypothetical protein
MQYIDLVIFLSKMTKIQGGQGGNFQIEWRTRQALQKYRKNEG